MSGNFTDDQVHAWLAGTGTWVSLHFDSPLHAGAYASELSGDGYVRQSATFTTPTNRAIWNTNVIRFQGLPATVIVYLGGWNARTQGDLLWYEELTDPFRVLSGGGYTLQPQTLVLSFS